MEDTFNDEENLKEENLSESKNSDIDSNSNSDSDSDLDDTSEDEEYLQKEKENMKILNDLSTGVYYNNNFSSSYFNLYRCLKRKNKNRG